MNNPYTMEAGREMDALIAEHVMGFVWEEIEGDRVLSPPIGAALRVLVPYNILAGQRQYVPQYSTAIETAWEVVEHLRDLWTSATAGLSANQDFDPPFDDGAFFDILHRHADRRWPWAFLYITPLAICRAALSVWAPPEPEDPI